MNVVPTLAKHQRPQGEKLSESRDNKRISRILKHPKRKMVWGFLLLLVAIFATVRAEVNETNALTLAILFCISLALLLGYFRDRRFLGSRSDSEISEVKAAISANRGSGKSGNSRKKPSKSEIKEGNETWGKVVLKSSFGFGTTFVYSGGYIYSTTRMRLTGPEKLVSISSNTSLMNANPNAQEVWGGAMVTIQTESQVFTIKAQTDSKSLVFTPMLLKDMQELVAVGTSVIKNS
jgi:hypothetical protein